MAAFILRRLGVLGVILFGSSFILYNLAAISGDPTADLKLSNDPNRDFLVASLTRELQLDVPPPARYFLWLKGILGIFIGQPDFGMSRDGSTVAHSLALAIPVTIRLVLAATIFAIILGIAIGIITALRQYSRFDYSMTFVSFLMFSLPVFWVAVLLKEYLAISFNNFLQDPKVPLSFIIGIGLFTGIFWASIIGGTRKAFWMTFAIAGGSASALITFFSITGWFLDPSLGPIVVGGMAVGIAYGVTQLSVGLVNKAALKASLTMAAVTFVAYYPANWLFDKYPSSLTIFILASLNIALAVFVALGFSKIDRGPIVRTAVLTAFISSGLLIVDKFMQTWKPYMETDAINYRPVPTVGQRSDLLGDESWWISNLDVVTHLFLPTLALTLISFAGYIRFSRGTLLEVLNQDYIRTARAKGLTERTVIMRHAFRNTMIPLTTIMVVDFAGVIGGALITESVFGWSGMGTLFRQGLLGYDLNLLMGVFFITATLSVVANLIADLLYSALDPRIRVGSGA
ncbi:ABC transporter type 1, transmembrane domain MetI-like [Candidatus Nanopelagicaceae bacterium]|jgi:peptide/nickel transport system permease protein